MDLWEPVCKIGPDNPSHFSMLGAAAAKSSSALEDTGNHRDVVVATSLFDDLLPLTGE